MQDSILNVVVLGMMFGVIHAFDVDHVMAMATFADQETKRNHTLRYALKWGLGHGGILLCLGLLLAFIGYKLPSWFTYYAEILVGMVLIYLGAKLLFLLKKNKLFGSKTSFRKQPRSSTSDHAPLLIGMLHGVAGSAPLLTVLPNMLETQFLLQITVFSLGCLFGMFCFGLAFSAYQTHIKHFRYNFANRFTQLLGLSSIGLGAFWVFN